MGSPPGAGRPAGVGAAAWPPGPAHTHPESTVLVCVVGLTSRPRRVPELLASLGQSTAAARGVRGLRCLGLRFRPAALNFVAKDKSFKKCLLLRMDFQIHK